VPLFTITDSLGRVEIGGGHGRGHGGHGGHGGRGRGFRGRGFGGPRWGWGYYDDYYDPWAAPVFVYEDELPPGVQAVRGE
jgi:hypothetical protein